jgi:hypothetical protein
MAEGLNGGLAFLVTCMALVLMLNWIEGNHNEF